MSYRVLARKYRPQTFEEIIGQGHITRTLQNAIEADRIAQGFLFSGMRGVGKTTLARVFAKALNCKSGPTRTPCNACDHCREITDGNSVDVIEIDGASNTGVDDVRELRENVLYAPARTRYKVYIIDEVHMLSRSAFNALLKTLEEPPSHVIFIFATTEPHKVPITIQSRCQCFSFRKIPLQDVAAQLLHLAASEDLELDPVAAQLIARASEGSMRDAQSLMDQVVSFCGTTITSAETQKVLGLIDRQVLDACTRALVKQDAAGALALVEELSSGGQDLTEFCKALQLHLRNLLMIRILESPEKITSLPAEEIARLKEPAEALDEGRLIAFVEHLNRTEEALRRATTPRFLLEVALVKMTRMQPLREFREIADQLQGLERRLAAGHSPAEGSIPPVAVRKDAAMQVPDGGAAAGSVADRSEMDWETMVRHAQKTSPPVGSILEHAFLKSVAGDRIEIGFAKKVHLDMARRKIKQIREILQGSFHYEPAVELVLHEQPGSTPLTLQAKKKEAARVRKEQLTQESLQHRVVREAVKVFHGRITEVREFS
ncbi:MAG: DNA polymerase III subunit gamma/tau [Deltaproteobacteria bacterium]|nr:DNA polymerase III subunit gamma/tau [Deltaproteobacteria bacterium]